MATTLHHLNDSRSFRIAWALEELGGNYDLVKYHRTEELLAPEEMKQVHPLGKAPILVDGDETLVESQCILEHLSQTHDGQFSANSTQARFWLTYCESSLMPYMVMGLVLKTAAGQSPKLLRPVFKKFVDAIGSAFTGPNLKGGLKYLNDYLAKHEFLSDEDQFGIADIQMEFAIFSAVQSGVDLKDYPAIRRWFEAVHERPAYQAALTRAGR
ncbi:hypothetical protein BSR29_01090 [Boudabousia liubingyangii]|uniref:Glutathione S-transferase n=1 Tax=Boudabousia liubingyangii TaxID=1921764 RepID=A0A1Q5PPW1_9ACTO|nr:glutathione S-transferase [Boudabousia liubingyangii]OKL49584.1 hypothetical protein BSR29_01090 [Boudabousia liubingyangii]